MTRRPLRRRPAPQVEWNAGRNVRGAWVVLDARNVEPLRANDPVERLRAVFLAAQAPMLAVLLRDHIELLERLAVYGYLTGQMLEQSESLIAASAITLRHTKPLKALEDAADNGQRELDLDAA